MPHLIGILDIVLPIFMIVGLGFALRRSGFLETATISGINRLVFYVAGPVLLFRGAASQPLRETLDLRVMSVLYAVTLITAAVVHLTGVARQPAQRGVITQAAFRANAVFVGLPVIASAYGEAGIRQVAVLVGTTVPLYNLLSVLALALPQRTGRRDASIWRPALRGMVTNPLLMGCLLGMGAAAVHLPVPAGIDRSMAMLAQTAMPLGLLAVGATLDLGKLRGSLGVTLAVATVKLAVYPAAIFILLHLSGLRGIALYAPVLLMAGPTAAASYIMAVEMAGDGQLAAALIIGTTLASMPTLMFWIALFRWIG